MRYILYCRKSTDTEDKQVLSLESQEKELLDLAKANDLNVVKVLQESMSAKAQGRPVFASLMRTIESNEADAILCWKLDRLARNMADAGRVMDCLQRGVIQEIRTHNERHLPTDNVLMLAVQLGMANQYVRDLSENVKRGNRAKLERGEWPNHAPFGYKNDQNTKTLVIDRKTKPIVARIFDLYATGQYSLKGVVDTLYEEGFRTSAGTKIRKARVEMTLKNSFYFGMMCRDGKCYVGKHKPIISQALFDKCKEVSVGTSRPKGKKLLSPFRGLLSCADCGCMYTATLKKGYLYYFCTNGKGKCSAHKRYLRSEPVESLIAEALGAVRFDDELIEIMYEAARERYAQKFSYSEAIRKRLMSELETNIKQKKIAYETYSEGLLSKDIYADKVMDLDMRTNAISKQLKGLESNEGLITLERIKDEFKRANTIRNRFYAALPEQKRIVASEALWNVIVKDGKIQEVRYRTCFEILAKAPKNTDLDTLLAD